ncbi:hypothetical protein [Nitrosopumilus sp.]|uniref:hypothetical protein n=1 Tax=Nitrosopumilus sp. TaxID=2024843 RepID=UPI0029312E9C|nr:hypothetical protein [Nitrosopumilus sp.]
MSKSQEATKDVFGMYQENINNVFATINKEVPKFHQSITDLQQQCMQICENTTKTTLSLQREVATKTGINMSIPDATLATIRNTNEEITKAYSLYSQMVQTSIDTAKQNIKTFNDNAKSFADLNRNIVQSWMNTFAQTTNRN